jgi:hypothetical protein
MHILVDLCGYALVSLASLYVLYYAIAWTYYGVVDWLRDKLNASGLAVLIVADDANLELFADRLMDALRQRGVIVGER